MEDQRHFATDPAVGCGNILHALTLHRAGSPWLHETLMWLDHEFVDPRGDVHTSLSPAVLQRIVDDHAAWYARAGIRPKDVVGVHIDESIGYFVHFLALTGIGAIPLLINDVMPPAVVVRFLRKVGARRVFVDAAHEARLVPLLDGDPVELLRMAPGDVGGPPPGPYPHVHAADDVVLLCHTSGTTGLPKAVMFTHHGFFHGIREQLKAPFIAGAHRDLSALPQSHSAGVFRLMLNLLNGFPVLVSSKHDARSLLPAIASFQATRLFGFPRTHVDIAEQPDVGAYDLRSLRYWVNTGDAIHESHVKRLVELGDPATGSTFVDRFGSSEQGGALFMQEHRRGGQTFERCIGRPLEWVEAVILDDDGKPQQPGRAGLLAVKAPSVTPGYWQDPALTAQFRVGEYWLTGDIARRDASGCFFHLDRTVDAIRTRDGLVCSVELEELLQRECRAIEEATVVGVKTAAGDQVPIVIVRPSSVFAGDTAALLAECNRVCARHGHPQLVRLIIATAAEIPVGATGKVLKRELRDRYAQILTGDAT